MRQTPGRVIKKTLVSIDGAIRMVVVKSGGKGVEGPRLYSVDLSQALQDNRKRVIEGSVLDRFLVNAELPSGEDAMRRGLEVSQERYSDQVATIPTPLRRKEER